MNDKNISSEHNTARDEIWPRKLNKLLIGIGVLAFGLIIVNRLSSMFEAEDLPVVADVQPVAETPDAMFSQAVELIGPESDDETLSTMSDGETALTADALNIDEVFGSPVVFVSASEPAYVITENDVRIDVGTSLSDDVTLAGITGDRVILDKAGDLMSIALPDPGMQ